MICRSAALGKPPESRASLGHRIDPRHVPWTPPCGSIRPLSVDHGRSSAVGLVVQADMSNATAGAELEIVLNGLVTLQATDFVL